MNKTSKFIALLLVLIMSFSLLGACAKPAEPEKKAESKTEAKQEEASTTAAEATPETQAEATTVAEAAPAATEAPQADTVTISYWDFPNFSGDADFATSADFDKAMIAAFEAKNPGIKVEFQAIEFTDGPAKIETAIQTKTNPDVIYDAPGRIIDWARKGLLADFDDIIDKDSILEAAIKASSLEGKVYLYPQGVAPFLMGFNTGLLEELKLLDKLPLDKENRSWTVKEFEELLTAIHKAKPEISPCILYAKSQGGDQGPRAFISNLYGSWITDEAVSKYTINDEAGVKGLEWAKKAYDAGLLGKGIALDAGASIEEFGSGLAASTILYPVVKYKQFTKEEKIKSVLMPFPNEKGQAELEYLVAGPCVFDNGDAAKIAAAKKFVDFIINDEEWGLKSLKATGTFAAKKGLTGLYDDPELLFAESLSKLYGPYYNTIPGFAQMRGLWFPMVQAVLNGDKTAKEALDLFVKEADQTIKDAE